MASKSRNRSPFQRRVIWSAGVVLVLSACRTSPSMEEQLRVAAAGAKTGGAPSSQADPDLFRSLKLDSDPPMRLVDRTPEGPRVPHPFGSKPGPVVLPMTPRVAGGLDMTSIRLSLRQRGEEFRRCYETRLAAKPGLAGIVTPRFSIGIDGQVTEAAIESTTVHDRELEDCLVAEILRTPFAKPHGGRAVSVQYPLKFEPGEK